MRKDTRFYYKKSRIQQLRGFCCTVQNNCSARQAAEKMNLDHSTIAVQIRSLEDDLGIKLFKRTANHRLILTEKGNLFYEMAIDKLQAIEGLFDAFYTKLNNTEQNTIRIAAHHVVLSHILPKFLYQYQEQNPENKNVKIALSNISKEEAIKRLIDGKINLAIFPCHENEEKLPELSYINFLNYKPVVVTHKNHPLSKKEIIKLEDIKNYPFLLVDKFSLKSSMNTWMVEENMGSNFEFENATWEILKHMVKNNIGITGFSEIYIDKEEKDLRHKKVEHIFPKIFFTIITKKYSLIGKKTQKIIDLITSNYLKSL